MLKTQVKLLLLLSIGLAFTVSCKKNSNTTEKPILTLSKSTLKRGEPLIVSTNEVKSDLVIKWSANPPSPNTWISGTGSKSVFLFSTSGSYSVTASYFTDSSSSAPYDSSSSPVVVTDSLFNDSVAQCNAILQVPISVGDQIFLLPVSYSDTGLVLLAHTQDVYGNQYPALSYNTGSDSTVGFEFDFGAITEYPCGNGTDASTPTTTILTIKGLSNGSYNLRIVLNSIIYNGTLLVTDSNCSFSWNYAAGVTISPLVINRQ